MKRPLKSTQFEISRRIHDQRTQSRLQFGSALALGVGLLISASIFFGLFDIPRSTLTDFLRAPRPPGLSDQLQVEQDRLTQIIVIFLVALLAGATLPHVRWLTASGLTLLYFVVYLSYTFRAFDEGIIVQPLYPILALLLTSAGTMVFRYFFDERPREFLKRMFRRYVAPDAVDQVLRTFEGGALPLGGVRREVSILYVDLRDFGGLAESLAPQATVKLLNEYMTLIVGAIFRHAGSVSKHTGDTIIAVWNLPLDQVDHARRAVRAALEMHREIAEIREKPPEETTVQIGIGVATGSIVAAHIGASSRAEYTILGEVVGMAERMAMKPDRGIFVDAATREQIGDEFETREVNPVRLRRRTDARTVWQIVAPMQVEEELVEEEEDRETVATESPP